MRILMISPHPTYSPRGTPISVLNRCRALCALGHQVDLVTYGIGSDVQVSGLTWLRAPVPGIRQVKVGPSAAKLPLDLAVFVRATRLAIAGRKKYDAIHSHEEAGIIGVSLARLVRTPHVYDMGNDLSVVMRNYGFSRRNMLTVLAGAVENATVRGSRSVIAHFPAIAERANTISHGRVPVVVTENVPLEPPANPLVADRHRRTWSPDGLAIALYTGTLEPYQGLPMLVEGMQQVRDRGLELRLVIVGGSTTQQAELRQLVSDLRIEDQVTVSGAVPMSEIRSCLQAADILVSPRAAGSNTPLKLFSYMQSGKPILATSISSHTQVLDHDMATLVEPSAGALADGLQTILETADVAAKKASVARQIASDRYGLASYVRCAAEAYVPLGAALATESEINAACAIIEADLRAATP